MRYRALMLLGAGLFIACLVTFCLELTSLLDTGTCASGGPYVVANECPDGTVLDAMLLTGSIIGLFVAAGIVLAAGHSPSRRGPGPMILLHGWAVFFTVAGAVSLIHSLTSDVVGPDGKLGGVIVGATFLVMGLPALFFSIWMILAGLRSREDSSRQVPG